MKIDLLLALGGLATSLSGQPSSSLEMVAYVRNGREIRLVAPDGTNDRLLWEHPRARQATGIAGIHSLAWHPGSESLVFSSDHEGAYSYYDYDLYTIRLNGTAPRRLTNTPDLSELTKFPKGQVSVTVANRQIPYPGAPSSSTTTFFLVHVGGAEKSQTVVVPPGGRRTLVFEVAKVADAPQPVVAIGGLKRWPGAPVRVQPGQNINVTLDITSSGFESFGAFDPAWSSDGTRVAYRFGLCAGIWSVPAAPAPGTSIGEALAGTGKNRAACAFDWAPAGVNGPPILYAGWLGQTGDTDNSIYQTDEEGSKVTRLVHFDSALERITGVQWIPDGSGFLFTRAESRGVSTSTNLYRYDFRGRNIAAVTRLQEQHVRGFAVSPDGRWVMYERGKEYYYPSDTERPALWLIRTDGSQERLFVANGSSPAWGRSPGSRTISKQSAAPDSRTESKSGTAQTSERDLAIEPLARRVALVIGNTAYPKWPLKNPGNDAKSIASALRELSFETNVVLDGSLRTVESAIDRFVGGIRPGDVAVFYYSGHGVQLAGENYLIPVDFDAKDEADAKYAAYSISRVQDRMENAGARLSMLILDACRNNPFRTGRAAGGGLAVMNSGRGTFIAFATGPGKIADDNPRASNGLFTSHLISALQEPGLTLDGMFNRVREKVYAASEGQQVPWTVSSVIGEFRLRSSGALSSAKAEASAPGSPAAPETAPPTPRHTEPAPAPGPEPPTSLAARSMEAVNAYKRRDYELARRIAQEVLRIDLRQKEALFALAASAYDTTDFDLFERAAPAAVRNGAGMSFTLVHHHTLTGGHPATLGIKQSTIVFVPLVKDCNQRAFEEPLANIVSASQTATTKGEVFLTLKIRDSQGKVRTLNFADPGSTVDKAGGLPVLREPADAARRLQVLASVIATAANPSVPAYTNKEEGGATLAPARTDSAVPDVQRPYSTPNANPERGGTAGAPKTVAPGTRSRVPEGGSVLICKDPARLDFAMENARNGNSNLALQALKHDAFFRVNGPASLEVRESELKSSWPKVFVRVLDGDSAGKTGWVLLSELKDLKQPAR